MPASWVGKHCHSRTAEDFCSRYFNVRKGREESVRPLSGCSAKGTPESLTLNPKPHEDRVYQLTQNEAERSFEDFFECDLAC